MLKLRAGIPDRRRPAMGYIAGSVVDDEFNAYAVAMLKVSDARKFKSVNVVVIYEPRPR
jgi:hypothetical protein